MPRPFRYSGKSYVKLGSNAQHAFAQRHALNIYAADAIYSFIPKNACSTMRTSLAIANGCIGDASDFNWIHQNNETFSASLAELARASYTFTILRCPYTRLLSVYLDKFLERNSVAWRYIDLHKRTIEYDDITFEFFVKSLCKRRVRHGDIHWTPQTAFLVYEDYDDYFAFEDFETVVSTLERRIGLSVVDARPLTKHSTTGARKLSVRTPYRLSPFELLGHKKHGRLPAPRSMYTKELVACVKRAYREDIALYKRVCGAENLLFK